MARKIFKKHCCFCKRASGNCSVCADPICKKKWSEKLKIVHVSRKKPSQVSLFYVPEENASIDAVMSNGLTKAIKDFHVAKARFELAKKNLVNAIS